MLPTTKIDFPDGGSRGSARVLAVHELEAGRFAVLTDSTPFHPVDHTWPDQPGDTGTLGGLTVVDTVTAAGDGQGVFLGEDIPARRGDPEWSWHVAHVVEGEPPEVGSEVDLLVDAGYRAALSAGHTGCHLLAFALNAALADRWRKEVRADSLGSPDFDSLAMVRSRILEGGSIDEYRIGKSLRKKGFTAGELAADAPGIEQAVNEKLAEWCASAAKVAVRSEGPLLTDLRTWECELPNGTASVPCGGTHLGTLAELWSLRAELTVSEDETGLTIRTSAERG
ncbi:metal-dependent hydrolase [Sciscionella sediminilitoris]|uniref:metal-dependent hydrolase n=1 Tax=Sciscionella sediminilitoris TaxID=1445613 RepID=UPI0004DF6B7C|nr:metal-dependent hydrolase [Sciscionella sp. SE31]